MNHYDATQGIDISKSCFFLDFLMFIAFVQNNVCGIILKAVSCRYNLQIFFIYRFILFTVKDNRVKKDLLIK